MKQLWVDGTIPVPGTIVKSPLEDYIYVEISGEEDPDDVLTDYYASTDLEVLPQGAGSFAYFLIAVTPNGIRFGCFTFRGDTTRWWEVWKMWCSQQQRRWGVGIEGKLRVSDGSEFELSDCQLLRY